MHRDHLGRLYPGKHLLGGGVEFVLLLSVTMVLTVPTVKGNASRLIYHIVIACHYALL